MSALLCGSSTADFDSRLRSHPATTLIPKTAPVFAAVGSTGQRSTDLRSAAPRLDGTAEAASQGEAAEASDSDVTGGTGFMQLAAADPMVRIVRLDPGTASLGENPPRENAPQANSPDANSSQAMDKVIDQFCLQSEECIDRYLWSIYEQVRKVDTVKVSETIKVTVKKKGKVRTRSKVVTKFVTEDFSWKDPEAAEKAGMTLPAYVIGGMDRDFKIRLYRLFRALEDADLAPGMTSGFRDDYRQSIASGNKAATGRSYHGGSMRGGYGHGLAADIVSMKGETRAERWTSTETLWKWVDDNGQRFGIGRPYLDRDPPHVGPIDGEEYLTKRMGKGREANTQHGGWPKLPKQQLSKSDSPK
jgi:hypothetical protein